MLINAWGIIYGIKFGSKLCDQRLTPGLQLRYKITYHKINLVWN